MRRSFSLVALVVLSACSREKPTVTTSSSAAPPAQGTAVPDDARWLLAGSSDQRFARVAKHLRGFDVAMIETGYRYSELYWAGRDRNWDYADYQLRKIEIAVANGVERRPRRAESARMLDGVVGALREAIAKHDAAAFDAAFAALTATCNACHQAERVPFIRVQAPTVRMSPSYGGPEAPP